MNNFYFKDIYPYLCQRHPNKNIYLISDHHFFHSNIIRYQRSSFEDVVSMNQFIIKKHNETVGLEDIVIFLGDFSFRKNEIQALLKQMNGYKYLILGNHDDRSLRHNYIDMGFEQVFTIPLKIDGDFLSHYPLNTEEFQDVNFQLLQKEFYHSLGINYHGHIHNGVINNNRFVNVSCEMQDYTPLLWGVTKKITNEDKPFLIEDSKLFQNLLNELKNKYHLKSDLVILDYLYSLLLSSISSFGLESFIYGSYPLYKKYNYVSSFSDLDVCLIYNEFLSKSKNYEKLKEMFHSAFSYMNSLSCLDLNVYKKMCNMCIFQLVYKNPLGNAVQTYFDSNLVPLNIYCEHDFILGDYHTLIETYFGEELSKTYNIPKYQVQFLNANGDMANLILQILFQHDFLNKKITALKKLKVIYKKLNGTSINFKDLENVLSRFFIRNVLFFRMAKRRKDIEFLKEKSPYLEDFLKHLSENFSTPLSDIFYHSNSLFNYVYQELIKTNFDDIPKKCEELIRILK